MSYSTVGAFVIVADKHWLRVEKCLQSCSGVREIQERHLIIPANPKSKKEEQADWGRILFSWVETDLEPHLNLVLICANDLRTCVYIFNQMQKEKKDCSDESSIIFRTPNILQVKGVVCFVDESKRRWMAEIASEIEDTLHSLDSKLSKAFTFFGIIVKNSKQVSRKCDSLYGLETFSTTREKMIEKILQAAHYFIKQQVRAKHRYMNFSKSEEYISHYNDIPKISNGLENEYTHEGEVRSRGISNGYHSTGKRAGSLKSGELPQTHWRTLKSPQSSSPEVSHKSLIKPLPKIKSPSTSSHEQEKRKEDRTPPRRNSKFSSDTSANATDVPTDEEYKATSEQQVEQFSPQNNQSTDYHELPELPFSPIEKVHPKIVHPLRPVSQSTMMDVFANISHTNPTETHSNKIPNCSKNRSVGAAPNIPFSFLPLTEELDKIPFEIFTPKPTNLKSETQELKSISDSSEHLQDPIKKLVYAATPHNAQAKKKVHKKETRRHSSLPDLVNRNVMGDDSSESEQSLVESSASENEYVVAENESEGNRQMNGEVSVHKADVHASQKCDNSHKAHNGLLMIGASLDERLNPEMFDKEIFGEDIYTPLPPLHVVEEEEDSNSSNLQEEIPDVRMNEVTNQILADHQKEIENTPNQFVRTKQAFSHDPVQSNCEQKRLNPVAALSIGALFQHSTKPSQTSNAKEPDDKDKESKESTQSQLPFHRVTKYASDLEEELLTDKSSTVSKKPHKLSLGAGQNSQEPSTSQGRKGSNQQVIPERTANSRVTEFGLITKSIGIVGHTNSNTKVQLSTNVKPAASKSPSSTKRTADMIGQSHKRLRKSSRGKPN